jgi:hypothetical protein
VGLLLGELAVGVDIGGDQLRVGDRQLDGVVEERGGEPRRGFAIEAFRR